MTDYGGPDLLVGSVLATVGPSIVYWDDTKSLDVQRWVNVMVLSIEEEKSDYVGFGRESFKDVDVRGVLYLLEQDPLALGDEDTLEGYLQSIHDLVNQYDTYTANGDGQPDTVVGNPVVWLKIMSEHRDEELRGIILYEIEFEVRVYIPQP